MTASIPGLDQALQLFRKLNQARTFRKERLDDADVRGALEIIGDAAREGGPSERLDALSTLGRVGKISAPIQAAVSPLIAAALAEEIPDVADWGNAEDRYYLATAVALGDQPWISDYAARQLALAGIQEDNARDSWAQLALVRAPTLTSVFSLVAQTLQGWLSEQTDSIDVGYQRLENVVEAFSRVLPPVETPTGEKLGQALALLIRTAGGGTLASTLRLRERAADAALDLTLLLLRLRYETRFDSDIYRGVGSIRNWWRPARPSQPVESKVDRIARMAVEALHVLARQGVRDVELRNALVRAVDGTRVNTVGAAIAASDPSLTPEISTWLATGQDLASSRSSSVVQELNDQDVDQLVARALLAISAQDVQSSALDTVSQAIDLFEPGLATTISRAARRIEVVRESIEALAAKRRLTLLGSRGEVVAFDPAMHESYDTIQRLSSVQIATPGVLKSPDARPSVVLIKALVETP